MIRVFNHHISFALIVTVLLESMVFLVCISAAIAADLYWFDEVYVQPLYRFAVPVMMFVGVMSILAYSFGIKGRELEAFSSVLERLLAAFILGLIILSLIFYLYPPAYIGPAVLASALCLAFVLILCMRWFVLRRLVLHNVLQRRAIVLGAGQHGLYLWNMIQEKPLPLAYVVGFVPADSAVQVPGEAILDLPLSTAVQVHRIQEVIVALDELRSGYFPAMELLELRFQGIKITEFSIFIERETGRISLQHLKLSWLIFGEGFERGVWRTWVKRAFDVVAGFFLCVGSLPLMVLVAILIKLDSPGPIFYRQTRVGQGGCLFSLLKFRSMKLDAEKNGQPRWASANDVRITRLGRYLRQMRVDELPQIVNVLKGDMSLVGPRPEREYFVQKLAQDIPYYNTRHSVKPGLTGWAQVRYVYGASTQDARKKLEYDLYYIKNHSLLLDVIILLKTIEVVVLREGAL